MKFFKNKSKKKVEAPVPRDLAAIQAEYNELTSKAGQLQYVMHIQEKDLAQVNAKLEYINHEANARNKLDAEAKAKADEAAK